MAEELPYEIFLQTITGLPLSDIQASCQSNHTWNSFCREPSFWSDLILKTWLLTDPISFTTSRDYDFLYNLFSLRITPDRSRFSSSVEDLARDILVALRDEELEAYTSRQPIKYYLVNPLYFTTTEGEGSRLNGLVITAYSLAGALLKLNNELEKEGHHELYDQIDDHMDDFLTQDHLINIIKEDLYFDGNSSDRPTDPYNFFLVTLPRFKLI